ncbi:ATP-binding protein [Virgibacillus sediminis]|uniref:AAA family ATPase n=1 Tax=Virgibacillus sediminis TaxID=202260 RepID=A0ABV7A4E7_9BACI
MQLVKAVIYGFGKWVDEEIDFSAASPLVIYGENESGKSTIQQFLLFMLFGLPPKKREFYRPKKSGKMGGRLYVELPGTGVVAIERLDEARNGAAVCYGPGGEQYPEEWLEERLHGMTASTYQSIYSFSALDLNGLPNMKENDLGEVILGIGLTGSQNLYAVERKLDQQIGELFKPYGKKPAINERLALMDGLAGDLRRFKETEDAYQGKIEEARQMEQQIERIKTEVEQLRDQQSLMEKQQQALPLVKKYRTYTDKLKGFPPSIAFPEKGRERLEQLKEKLLPLKSEQALLEANVENYQSRVDELEKKLEEESFYEQAEEVLQQKGSYMDAVKEQERITSAARKKEIQLESEIQQLNAGLTMGELSSLELPFHVEKNWNRIKTDADQLYMEENRLQQEYQELKQQRNYLLNQAWEAEDGMLAELEYQELQEKLSGYKEMDLLRQVQEGSERKREEWKKQKAHQEKISNLLLTVSFTIAAFLAVLAVLLDQPALFWGIPVLLVLAVGQKLYWKSHRTSIERFLTEEDGQQGTQILSQEEKREAEQAISNHEKKSSELAVVKEQLKTVDIQFIKLDEKRRGIDEKRRRLDTLIAEQHDAYPFLEQVEITYWPEFYHYIKRAAGLFSEYRQLLQEKEEIDKAVQEHERSVMDFFQESNIKLSTWNPVTAFQQLEEILEQLNRTVGEIKQYEHLIAENRQSVHDTIRKAGVYQQEIEELWKAADVETEEAYYRKARQSEEKLAIETEIKRLEDQLDSIFPDGTWKGIIEQTPKENELENSQRKRQETLKELEEKLDLSRQQLADAKAAISTMESSEDYSHTLHQFSVEKEKLRALAHQWAVLKTAREMLEKTKRAYRDKYLSQVMEKASRYFTILTDNSYLQVYPPSGDLPFQAEAQDGVRYRANELSQGTINQLYISLRLAIADIMSEKHSLPFIIDDAFVHFDAVRTRRILEILNRQEQQVIIFTCREEVRDQASFTIRIHG